MATWRSARAARAAPGGPRVAAPRLRIVAADPYTSQAYRARTGLPCLEISFADIAFSDGLDRLLGPGERFDVVVVSFALHLAESRSRSELWSLLTALAVRSRWLVVVAPHKRPEVRDNCGWLRYDPQTGSPPVAGARPPPGIDVGDGLEIVRRRVRLRLYRSATAL